MCTKLVWAKAEFAQVGNKKKTWEEAIRFANNRALCQDGTFQGDVSEIGDCSEHGGIKYDDFRLPNIQEILEVTKIAPSLILPWGGTYRYYWSSTSADGNNYWSAGNEYDWGETSITSKDGYLCVQIVRDDF